MPDNKITKEEIESIRKELTIEIKENISKWAKGRFWFVSVLIGAVTVFGMRGVLEQVYKGSIAELQDTILDSRVASELADKAADDVRTEIDSLRPLVAELQNRAKHVSEQLAAAKSNYIEGKYTEDAPSKSIIAWLWPDGVGSAPNRGNVTALRRWIDISMGNLPIQKFLDHPDLETTRKEAIKELSIPSL